MLDSSVMKKWLQIERPKERNLDLHAASLVNSCHRMIAKVDCELKRKFGMEGELEVVGRVTWRNCVQDVHEEGWQEEVGEESYLQERQEKEFGSKGEVRLRFRLRMVPTGLLGDKARCGMCKDGKCEQCDDGVVEDIVHFLLHCGEFVGDKGRLLGIIEGIEGTEEWIAECRNKGDEGRVGLLLGRSVAGVKG